MNLSVGSFIVGTTASNGVANVSFDCSSFLCFRGLFRLLGEPLGDTGYFGEVDLLPYTFKASLDDE